MNEYSCYSLNQTRNSAIKPGKIQFDISRQYVIGDKTSIDFLGIVDFSSWVPSYGHFYNPGVLSVMPAQKVCVICCSYVTSFALPNQPIVLCASDYHWNCILLISPLLLTFMCTMRSSLHCLVILNRCMIHIIFTLK